MVDNNRRTKRLPSILFSQLLIGLVICLLALSLLAYAQGYRYDYKHWRLLQTGILVLNYQPKDAIPTINDKKICAKYPCVANLPAGNYNIIIGKEGYADWRLDLKLESESVNIFQDIILFNKTITPAVAEDQDKIAQLSVPVDTLAINSDTKLSYNDYEIWVGDQLVTRLSSRIYKAAWYPDLAHIIYQQQNEIWIIEKTGQNDTLLVRLDQAGPTRFAVGNRGQELYYIDSGQYFEAKIR